MRKIRIVGLPEKPIEGKRKVKVYGMSNSMQKGGQNDFDKFIKPGLETERSNHGRTLNAVPREKANIEAEDGETVVVPGKGGIPEHFNISGKKHKDGGVPLNLESGSFVFSDYKKEMKIKDKDILAEFGVKGKKNKSYTPADLAKKYDINKYKTILSDPNSDEISRNTAELMIKNYNDKLAKLALVQESMKNFDDGIPQIAQEYAQKIGLESEINLQQEGQQFMQNGGTVYQQMENKGLLTNPYEIDSAKLQKIVPGLEVTPGIKYMRYNQQNTDWMNEAPMGSTSNIISHKNQVYFPVASTPSAQTTTPVTTEQTTTNNTTEQSTPTQTPPVQQNPYITSWTDEWVDDPNMPGVAKGYWKKVPVYRDYFTVEPEYKKGGNVNLTKYQTKGEVEPEYELVKHTDGKTYRVYPDRTFELHTETEEIKKDSKAIKVVDVPAKYKTDQYNMASPDFDKSKLKSGDIIKDQDGKYKKVVIAPTNVQYTGEDKNQVFGANDTGFSSSYALLEEKFSNPIVAQEFANKTREALRNKEYYKGKRRTYSEMFTEDEINSLSDQELVNQFLEHQKRNYALQAQGIDPNDFSDGNGSLKSKQELIKEHGSEKGNAIYNKYQNLNIKSLNDGFDMIGMPLTQDKINKGDLGIQQATYWGYHDLIKDRDNLPSDVQEELKYFDIMQHGVGDEPLNKTISPIDSKRKNFYTNTTSGHLALVDDTEMRYEDLEETELTPFEEKNIDPSKPGFDTDNVRDEWWAQDIGNMGNLFGQRMGLKKYLPNSQQIDLANPDVMYYDPSRALAANAEQAAMASQATGLFSGPQSTYRQTAIQGEAFKNAANVLGEFENRNVAIGNQYLDKVQATDNQETLANAQRLDNMYDQWTIANQQFDNSKRMTNRNLFEGWRDGLTNKKQTQALNALYPQFETQPGIGGGMYFTGKGRPITGMGFGQPESTTNDNYLMEFRNLKRQYPDLSDKMIQSYMEKKQQPQQQMLDPEEQEKKNWMSMYMGVNK